MSCECHRIQVCSGESRDFADDQQRWRRKLCRLRGTGNRPQSAADYALLGQRGALDDRGRMIHGSTGCEQTLHDL